MGDEVIMPFSVNKFERVEDPADPDRCQSVTRSGQCVYKAVEGSNYCPRHGGNKAVEAAAREENRRYRLAILQSEYKHFADDDKIKGLQEEIGLLRLTLQTHLDTVREPGDLLLISHQITDIIEQISRLVERCHKLDQSLGGLLDRKKIITFAEEVVQIITAELTKVIPATGSVPIDDVIDAVADQITESVKRIVLPTSEEPE
jgi:hypothetical protein